MLHGEAAIFVSFHCEPPVSRDPECIRKMNVMTELNLALLFQKKTAVLTSRKARKSKVCSAS